jgi:Zn finger protein HypA/HybF involved in hydrogenase expression
MHEMARAEGVRSIVEDAGWVEGFERVSAAVLEIGELAAVEVTRASASRWSCAVC